MKYKEIVKKRKKMTGGIIAKDRNSMSASSLENLSGRISCRNKLKANFRANCQKMRRKKSLLIKPLVR